MKSIDFLPDIYRQRESLRRARFWWVGVVALFGGTIFAAATAQAWLRHSLVEQLDALAPEFAAAQSRVQEVAALQTQVARAVQEASLYTFLQNPWPRTQILAEVIGPLNEHIRLSRLTINEEEIPRSTNASASRNEKQPDDSAAKLSLVEKDLACLEEEANRRQTTIEIEGRTTSVSLLHEYVNQIHHSPLMASATIKSLEAATTNELRHTRFTLRLIVRPGYCQQPNAPAGVAAAQNDRLSAGGGQ